MARHTEIDLKNVPKVRRLFKATHRVLVERLLGTVSIEAWNELIEAHDDLCTSSGGETR